MTLVYFGDIVLVSLIAGLGFAFYKFVQIKRRKNPSWPLKAH